MAHTAGKCHGLQLGPIELHGTLSAIEMEHAVPAFAYCLFAVHTYTLEGEDSVTARCLEPLGQCLRATA